MAANPTSISIPLAMLVEHSEPTGSICARISTGRTRDGQHVVFVNGQRVDEWKAAH